jgi:hypothetical protein
MSVEKMHDEKFERRSGSEQVEDGLVEDDRATSGLLFKMDVRYACYLSFILHLLQSIVS